MLRLLTALAFVAGACTVPDEPGEARAGAAGGPPAAGPNRSAAAAWSIDDARVLFTGRRGGAADLYLLDRSSGEIRRLTRFGSAEAGANGGRVSPDGVRIAFQIRRQQNYDIHVMDLAGGEPVNLTAHPAFDVAPQWSPDGRRIAFMSTRGYELGSIGPFPGHLYVMSDDGSGLRRLTGEPLTSALGPSDWSADGKTLLMARVAGERPDLFLLDVASGRETRLTDTPEGEYSAVFSHDGRRIACHAETAEGAQIVVLDLDGGGRRAVTAGPGWRYYPRWSPDDRWLLFTASDDGEQYDLQAVRVEDGRVIDLVATPEDEREGEWLPAVER